MKVKKKYVITLLDFKILADGLKQFFINWALKIAKMIKIQGVVSKLLGFDD
jgi:hypothetical protein